MLRQLIQDEQFTNVQRAQAGLTKLFKKAEKANTFYRVLRNDEPLGVLIPNNVWDNLIEDIEASASPRYLKLIDRARNEKESASLQEVKRKLNL